MAAQKVPEQGNPFRIFKRSTNPKRQIQGDYRDNDRCIRTGPVGGLRDIFVSPFEFKGRGENMRNILRFRVVAMVLLALGLFAGSFAAVGAQGATPISGEPGTLVVAKFECTQIEEPTATVSDPVGVSAGVDDDVPAPEGCVPDSESFQIFLNNDFSSEPFAEFEAGVEAINGIPQNAPGVPHLLLETEQNVFFEFFVESGGVTTITVLNPADDGNATPVADDDDDGNGNGDGDGDGNGDGNGDATDVGQDGDDGDGSADGGAAASDDDDDSSTSGSGSSVSSLPSTGQGADSGTSGSSIVLLFGAMSLVALAAGFAWRQRRTA